MEIGPINNGKPAAEQPDSQQKKDVAAAKADRATDDVIISKEAQERLKEERAEKGLGIDEDRPVVDSIDDSPEKLRLIRERIDSGYYHQAKIIDRTVEKMIDQMLENIQLFYK